MRNLPRFYPDEIDLLFLPEKYNAIFKTGLFWRGVGDFIS
jgi:hypothetical protein